MDVSHRIALVRAALELDKSMMELLNVVMKWLESEPDKKDREFWVRNWVAVRPDYGAYDNLMRLLKLEDLHAFKNFLRVTPEMYTELVHRLSPRLQKHDTWYRDCLQVGLKVAITLRHLATGDSYHSLMYLFYVPHNTISLLVKAVCQAIYQEYADEVINNPRTPEGWKQIADKYSTRWNFHHVLGALDGKHVRVQCPAKGGSMFYNYKKYHSIVLMALVDADYQFRWVSVGGPGSSSDAQLWNNCQLKEAIAEGTLGIPDPDTLPGDDRPIPYFIIGDDAFALKESMMKPFSASPLPLPERVFNYRLSRARRCVENAFGILANRFGCLLRAMRQKPETVEDIVLACVCLHNLLGSQRIGENIRLVDREDQNHDVVPGAWRATAAMDDMERRLRGNNDSQVAKLQRLYLKHYYNGTAGAVPWQQQLVV
jgi:hypothetical protein